MPGAGSPTEVVAEQKRVAWTVYVILIMGFLGATIYTIVAAVEKRKDPPVAQRTITEKYRQPEYRLCFTQLPDLTANFSVNDEPGVSSCFYSLNRPGGQIPDCDASVHRYVYGGACVVFNKGRKVTFQTKDEAMYLQIFFNFSASPPNPADPLYYPLEWQITASDKDLGRSPVYDRDLDSVPPQCLTDFFGDICQAYVEADYAQAESQFVGPDGALDFASTFVPFGVSQIRVNAFKTKKLNGDIKYEYDMTITQSAFQHPFDNSLLSTTHSVITKVTINDLRVDYFEETDPVSPETIVGVISGFWGYVGILFGIFFQSPAETTARLSDVPRKLTAKWKARKSKGGATEMAGKGTTAVKEAASETIENPAPAAASSAADALM